MALVTLATLRQRARVRADMVNSQFISDSDFNALLNASADELYDLLVEKFEDYFTKSSTLSLVAGTEAYSLPTDFYKLVGLDLQVDSQRWKTLEPFNVRERNSYRNLPAVMRPGYDMRYWLRAGNVAFLPVPTQSWTVTCWYVPQRTQMAADADTFDGVNGWEEYIVIDAAAKAVVQEEGDVSALLNAKAEMKDRIQRLSSSRDAGAPQTVSDTSRDELVEW